MSNDAFRRAGFNEINNNAYQLLKARLIVASEAIQHSDPSPDDYARLDESIVTGVGYLDLIKRHFGVASGGGEAPVSMFGSFVSTAKAWTIGTYDESDVQIQSLLRKASQHSDSTVLDLLSRDWIERVPRSAGEVLSLAKQWLLEKLEVQSNTYAHRVSDDQFRSGENTYRAQVEQVFKPMVISRLRKMKDEVNKAELENSSG